MIEKITNFLLDKLKIKNEKIKKLIPQIIKFIIVGGIAFVIDYGIMVLCKEVLHFNVYLSAFLGFTISVIYNYIASVTWVFDVNKDKNKVRNFILFVVFSVIGLGLTELIMWVGVDLIHISYLIVKIIATILVMIFNFITRKLFLE